MRNKRTRLWPKRIDLDKHDLDNPFGNLHPYPTYIPPFVKGQIAWRLLALGRSTSIRMINVCPTAELTDELGLNACTHPIIHPSLSAIMPRGSADRSGQAASHVRGPLKIHAFLDVDKAEIILQFLPNHQ